MLQHPIRSGVVASGLAASVVVAMIGAAPAATAAARPARTAIAHSTPTWLGHATRVGAISPATAETLTVDLAPDGGSAALADLVTAVSTPGSASYRHYLTTAQYYARFAPTAAEVQAVSSWLEQQGLTVRSVAAHNESLTVTGTAAKAEAAFGVTLQTYRHDGQTVQAPSGATSVPASISSEVLAVGGLDTTRRIATVQTSADATVNAASTPSDSTPPPAAFANARPCSSYYGQIPAKYQADYKTKLPTLSGKTLPYAVCGYTGPQLRSAYEGGVSLSGKGVTVGIVDAYAAPTIAADANTYATDHGDGAYTSGQLSQTVDTPFTEQDACGENGWWGEETLDVEAVHAMAPNAKIHFYGGASCEDDDLLATLQQAVDADQVQVISNSYGDTEADATAAYIASSEKTFQQAALEGISILFSSGDDGDELAATGIKQADYQTSDPYVTAVGGTSTAIGSDGSIEFQTGWGTDKYSLSSTGKSWRPLGYLYGSGGGYSSLFNRPSYQQGVVPASAPAGRAVPDVAMDADPTTGMLVGETQLYPDGTVAYGEYRIGGTSLASPLFAGMVALADQKAGQGTGFLNPAIYGTTSAFSDVKGTPPDAGNVRVDYVDGVDTADGLTYSIRTFDQDSSLTVTTGYDDVTGVGVPKPSFFGKIG